MSADSQTQFVVHYGDKLEDVEKKLILQALANAPTKEEAAQMAGISLKTLYNKLNRYKKEAP